MRRIQGPLLLATLLLAACDHGRPFNPCPRGMVREGEVCVDESTSIPADAQLAACLDATNETTQVVDAAVHEIDGSALMPSSEAGTADTGNAPASDATVGAPDAATPNDASMDGGIDANLTDAGVHLDATVDVQLDAIVDASLREAAAPEASPGDAAGDDSDAALVDATRPIDICTEQDLRLWRDFQLANQLIPTVLGCIARDPLCDKGACDLMGCVRAFAGVSGCSSCVSEEAVCTMGACNAECAASSTSDACRACACREGCIGRSASCGGMGPIDICADCNDYTCQQMSVLDPALIMVIIGG